jgi:hypothetical protein
MTTLEATMRLHEGSRLLGLLPLVFASPAAGIVVPYPSAEFTSLDQAISHCIEVLLPLSEVKLIIDLDSVAGVERLGGPHRITDTAHHLTLAGSGSGKSAILPLAYGSQMQNPPGLGSAVFEVDGGCLRVENLKLSCAVEPDIPLFRVDGGQVELTGVEVADFTIWPGPLLDGTGARVQLEDCRLSGMHSKGPLIRLGQDSELRLTAGTVLAGNTVVSDNLHGSGCIQVSAGRVFGQGASFEDNRFLQLEGDLALGTVIALWGGFLELEACSLSGNRIEEALNPEALAGLGGAVYIGASAEVTLRDVVAEGNQANVGGFLYSAREAFCHYEIGDLRCLNNEAVFGGGALVVYNSTLEIEESLFDGNHVGGSGGALSLGHCDATIGDSTRFIENRSQGGGGAVLAFELPNDPGDPYNEHVIPRLKVTASRFSGNGTYNVPSGSTGLGGAVAGIKIQTVFEGTLFDGNTLRGIGDRMIGGAVGVLGSTHRFEACLFRGNTLVGGATAGGDWIGSYGGAVGVHPYPTGRPGLYTGKFGFEIPTFDLSWQDPGEVRVVECRFEGNLLEGSYPLNSSPHAIGGAALLTLQARAVFVEGCRMQFNWMRLRSSGNEFYDAEIHGGVLAVVGPGLGAFPFENQLLIRNNLITDNRVSRCEPLEPGAGVFPTLEAVGLRRLPSPPDRPVGQGSEEDRGHLVGNTISANHYLEVSGGAIIRQEADLHVAADSPGLVASNNIFLHRAVYEPSYSWPGGEFDFTVNHCLQPVFPEDAPGFVPQVVSDGYPPEPLSDLCVGSDLMTYFPDFADLDYRLRWNSSLQDVGRMSPFAQDYERFDRTKPDIGWTPPYEEVSLSGSAPVLVAGHYLVEGDLLLSGPRIEIPDGVVLKLAGSASLILRNTGPDPSAYEIQVGDLAGARTAIVYDVGA